MTPDDLIKHTVALPPSDRIAQATSVVGNLFFNVQSMPNIGDEIRGHEHPYDHRTFILAGRVAMGIAENTDHRVFSVTDLVVTPAGVRHWFRALTPMTVICCIHPIRNGKDLADIAPEDLTLEQYNEMLAQFPVVY